MWKPARNRRVGRNGVAIVELAVCLPAIVLLVLGSIEACTMIFVKQSLHVAAYEGLRQAVKADATNTRVTGRCEQILTERRVKNATVDMQPSDIEDLDRGTEIKITISAPVINNSITRLRFFRNDLEADVTMVKE